jgi:hypothetical protein
LLVHRTSRASSDLRLLNRAATTGLRRPSICIVLTQPIGVLT